jgi:hypothetical protein
MRTKPKTIEAHLATLPADRREALERLRKTIVFSETEAAARLFQAAW